jgi:glycosyltransferase involved in cell wall biosynthesis
VFNGKAMIDGCLRALAAQNLPSSAYEIIVVDDGSSDDSAAVAEQMGARVVRQPNRGAPAARNAGFRVAHGTWTAFTDADCVPARNWLRALLNAVEGANGARVALGAAGRMIGYASDSPASRFVDLSGGLDAEHHLAHPKFPFAPSGNVMYRRDALVAVGGFDERYATYDACDLHTRLRGACQGNFFFEPRAVVLHRHRTNWKSYWKQQGAYGVGYAQFFLHHRKEVRWSLLDEAKMLVKLGMLGVDACRPGNDDKALLRRGLFAKHCAQHIGFVRTYCSAAERLRW